MHGRMRVRVAALALVVCLTALVAVRAGEDEPLLLRLIRPDVEGYEDARAAWEALADSERVALLREGLASSDRALAEVAAAEIGGQYLSLDEIHRRQALLQDRFGAAVGSRQHVWGVGGTPPVGAPDVVPLWRALADRQDVPRKEVTLELLHRVTLPEHLPDLVPLLAKGDEHYFESLFWTVCLVANYDASDRFRVSAERGIEFGLRRLRLERGYNPEALRALSFDAERPAWQGDGLPTGFIAVARAAWGLDPDGFRKAEDAGGDKLEGLPPFRWLHRQAARFTPLENDGTFIADVVRGTVVPLEDRWWAMRHLLRLSPDWGGEVVGAGRGRGRQGDARRGRRPRRGRSPRRRGRPSTRSDQDAASPLAWAVDPETARARWLRGGSAHGRRGLPVPRRELGARSRSPGARALPHDWGVRIADEDLRWIAARLAEAEVPAPLRGRLPRERAFPTTLTSERGMRRSLPRMATMPVSDEEERWLITPGSRRRSRRSRSRTPTRCREVLVDVGDALRGGRPQSRSTSGSRRRAIRRRCPRCSQSWPEWEHRPARPRPRAGRSGGGLPRGAPLQAEGEEAGSALAALCILRGIPPVVFDGFLRRRERRRGRPYVEGGGRAASSRATPSAPSLPCDPRAAELGLIRDPRVEAYLRRAREDRAGGTYWPATAGLALHGDAAARAELLALVREGRMWFFDGLLQSPDAVVLTCDGDTEFLDAWVGLVESNCCIGWAAEEVVFRERFPTMPVASTITGGFTTSAEVRAWLERYRGRMRYSRILGGWLPRAPAD